MLLDFDIMILNNFKGGKSKSCAYYIMPRYYEAKGVDPIVMAC
jgi:hypothetical protein